MKDTLLSKIEALSADLPGLTEGITSRIDLKYITLALFVILLLFVFLHSRQRKKTGVFRMQSETIDGILANASPGKGLEKNLSDFLGLIIPLVEAPGYYFYLLDKKSGSYVLKAVRHLGSGDGQIAPSYSGLVPYKKENYNPPLGIQAGQLPEKPAIVKDGQVPLLTLPVRGGAGMVRIGPVRNVPKKTMMLLEYLCDKLQPALDLVIETEKMKSQVEAVSASSEAIRSLTRSAMDLDGSLTTVMGLCIKMVDAAGGCFLFKNRDVVELAVVLGLEKETEDFFRRDQEAQYLLYDLPANREVLMLGRESKEYFHIPSYFAASGLETVLLLKVNGNTVNGTAIFWYYKALDIDRHRIAALQTLTRRLGDALDRQLKFKDLADSYLDMLRMLVDTVDKMEPYTVGHSELISRYSGIIAREMRLNQEEVREIILAGYLHDVGMLGLSGDILFKAGKYTDVEYETMKLHAEVGASIIESTISKGSVASYIRHHHERWDGYGYPAGLKGEDIPLGARIISVADMFNAKLTGRKYREPATFERAVMDLRAASGTQLDPAVVEVLIGWFRKKQADSSRKGRSLGPCWEMRCCPPVISKYCPAYKRTDVNCWEVEGVNCAAHGSSCASCLVHTEFVYRTGKTLAGGLK